MRKFLYKLLFFLILFLFLNIKPNETEDFVSFNYYDEDQNTEKYFTIKLYDFNILNLDIFDEENISILSITPKETKYNINNISFDKGSIYNIMSDSINNYKDKLIKKGYEEEAMYVQTKGFLISKIKILCTYDELFRLEKKINFKILST